MNYIYFNEKGRLKGKHLDDMIATSHLANKIYLFYDLDLKQETEYSASLTFKRSDGFEIGEIECLREASLILNPFTNTEMPASADSIPERIHSAHGVHQRGNSEGISERPNPEAI